MSGLTIRVKRGSRGSDTLLEAANRILRLLGVSSTKRGKQPSPKSKVRSSTPCAAWRRAPHTTHHNTNNIQYIPSFRVLAPNFYVIYIYFSVKYVLISLYIIIIINLFVLDNKIYNVII